MIFLFMEKKLIDDEEKITYIYLNKSELKKFLLGSFTIVLFHHNKADLKIIRDKWGGRSSIFQMMAMNLFSHHL